MLVLWRVSKRETLAPDTAEDQPKPAAAPSPHYPIEIPTQLLSLTNLPRQILAPEVQLAGHRSAKTLPVAPADGGRAKKARRVQLLGHRERQPSQGRGSAKRFAAGCNLRGTQRAHNNSLRGSASMQEGERERGREEGREGGREAGREGGREIPKVQETSPSRRLMGDAVWRPTPLWQSVWGLLHQEKLYQRTPDQN
jgi:hypothetical protein